MWKLLTDIIAEDAYWYLDDCKLLREVQKGVRKRSRGAHNLLFIDKLIMENASWPEEPCYGLDRLSKGVRHATTLLDKGMSRHVWDSRQRREEASFQQYGEKEDQAVFFLNNER